MFSSETKDPLFFPPAGSCGERSARESERVVSNIYIYIYVYIYKYVCIHMYTYGSFVFTLNCPCQFSQVLCAHLLLVLCAVVWYVFACMHRLNGV